MPCEGWVRFPFSAHTLGLVPASDAIKKFLLLHAGLSRRTTTSIGTAGSRCSRRRTSTTAAPSRSSPPVPGSLDTAFQQHPERFVRKAPELPCLPEAVWINKPLDPKEPPQQFPG